MICFAPPSELQSFLFHPPEISRSKQQGHLLAKQGETLREMAVKFANEVSLSYSAGFFNMP